MKIFFLFLIFLGTFSAKADVISTDETQEVESAQGKDLPDSSPCSPPLATDDPGTPGPGGYEINLLGTFESFRGGQNSSGGVDANLGIGERTQFRISKSAIHEQNPDQDILNGTGATSLGVKWRFFDDGNFKLAFYPSYQLDDATRGPSAQSEGRSFYLPVIVSKTFGLSTVLFNLGFSKNIDNDENSFFASVAGGRALSATLRIIGEFTSQKSKEGQRIDFRAGFVKEIYTDEKSNYETAVFGSLGKNLGWSEDGRDHWGLLAGFSIARRPLEIKE